MTLLAKDIMTYPVISVKPDTSLKELAELLEEHSFSGVPVVNKDEQVLGIISERDISQYTQQIIGQPLRKPYKLLTKDKEVLHVNVLHRGVEMIELVAATTVDKLMSQNVISVGEETSVVEVINIMNEHQINRIPVINQDNKLIGIITRENLISSLSQVWNEYSKD